MGDDLIVIEFEVGFDLRSEIFDCSYDAAVEKEFGDR